MNIEAGRCIGLNALHKCTGSKKRLPVNNNLISSKNYDDTKSVPQGVSEGVKIEFFKWKSILWPKKDLIMEKS